MLHVGRALSLDNIGPGRPSLVENGAGLGPGRPIQFRPKNMLFYPIVSFIYNFPFGQEFSLILGFLGELVLAAVLAVVMAILLHYYGDQFLEVTVSFIDRIREGCFSFFNVYTPYGRLERSTIREKCDVGTYGVNIVQFTPIYKTEPIRLTLQGFVSPRGKRIIHFPPKEYIISRDDHRETIRRLIWDYLEDLK